MGHGRGLCMVRDGCEEMCGSWLGIVRGEGWCELFSQGWEFVD